MAAFSVIWEAEGNKCSSLGCVVRLEDGTMSKSNRTTEKLKEVVVFRDSDGRVTAQKGTTCTQFSDGQQEWVEKQWVSGDWVFPGDYEYCVEKCVYETANALGLPVPRLLGSNDEERKLLIEYVTGSRVSWPCDDKDLLTLVLVFFDAFKEIKFTPTLTLFKMDEEQIHKYRLDQLQFIFPEESIWKNLDSIYESFLQNIQYCSIPFDRILKNTILCDGTLFFLDFEWTIAGPYEFTLARAAVEFNEYDNLEIMSRVTSMNLYHLFLLRFYMYGQEPESVSRYLRGNLQDPGLIEIFKIINAEEYADKPWAQS